MLDEAAVAAGVAATPPPGSTLSTLLTGAGFGSVPNDEIVDVLIAQSRQVAHEQARLFAVMHEVLHREPFAGPGQVRRSQQPVDFAADEVRAALSWTRRAAEFETDVAVTLVGRLPLVYEAMLSGVLDRGKVLVFVRHLADLPADQVEVICRALLPRADGWTTGQLDARLRQLIIQLDPDYYERRYRAAVRERQVCGFLDRDGSATVTGSGLPAAEAAAALERVDGLARAARRAGHPATLDQLRADLFLRLLDGSLHGMDRDQIIAALLAEAMADGADGDGPDGDVAGGDGPGGGPDDDPGPDGGAGGCGPDNSGPDDGEPGDHGPDGHGPGSQPENSPDGPDDAPDRAGPGGSGPGDDPVETGPGGAARDARPDEHSPASRPGTTGPARAMPAGTGWTRDDPGVGLGTDDHWVRIDQRVGIEIRLALSTLLGLDNQPGEIPGWGPVPASTARAAVGRQHGGEWRWAVTDPHGRLLSEGITRRRPAHPPRAGPRGGVIELHLPETLLTELATHTAAAGAWAGVVRDIAAQHERRDQRLRDLDAHPGDRLPRAALRRHTQIRDRTCVHKGCRAPARGCDQDHTVDHSHGGPTTSDDLAPTCRHDHRLKTEGGWRLGQPEPGRFRWTSPLGRTYTVVPEPILPPPLPQVPRPAEPWFDQPADDTDRPLTLNPHHRPLYNPHAYDDRPSPALAPQPLDLDDRPPF